MNETNKRIDTALRQAVRQRNYRRIRDRALRRLGNLHPDQYRELLEEERERDEAEQKVWLDITGRTDPSLGSSTFGGESAEVIKAFANKQSKGDDGAKA